MCSQRKKSGSTDLLLKEIEKTFEENKNPSGALELCKKAERHCNLAVRNPQFVLLYAKILRWCNKTQSAINILEKSQIQNLRNAEINARFLLEKGLALGDLRMSLSSISLLEDAIKSIRNLKNTPLELELRLALGQAKSNAGKQNEAIMELEPLLQKATKQNLITIIPSIYANLALCEFRLGNFEKSRKYAERGISFGASDPLGLGDCYRGIAIICSLTGENATAMENYRTSLKIFRDMHFLPGLVRAYLSLGGSYLRLGEVEMAEHFFQKALGITDESENPPLKGMVFSRLGNLHMAKGDYNEALNCYCKDRDLSKNIENPSNIAHIYKNIGNCLFMLGNFDEAEKILTESSQKFLAVNDILNYELVNLDIALLKTFSGNTDLSKSQTEVEKLIPLTQSGLKKSNENPLRDARALFVEACTALCRGLEKKAEEIMTCAMAITEQYSMYNEEAEMLLLFGKLSALKNSTSTSIKWLRQALRVAETYSLGVMAKNIIKMLDSLGEDNIVDYSFEKEASKIERKEIVVDAVGTQAIVSATENIIGSSEAIKRVLQEARQAAETDATILCVGPTGTGKELLARAIHRWSRRAGKKFIAVNCGAIPKELVESALFGHVRGAFSGAVTDQIGSIEAANGGTIFLDEITELPLASQVKLLRFLEYKEIQPLGVAEARKVDVRVIASTNRDPEKSVADGDLREDLYYRLSVIPIYLPPLSERGNDVIEIARHFIASMPLARKKGITGIEPSAEKWLKSQPWPGNIRELGNVILRAVVFANGPKITIENLECSRKTSSGNNKNVEKLDDLITNHIMNVLKMCNGNQIKAAKILGIHRNTLRNKISKIMQNSKY